MLNSPFHAYFMNIITWDKWSLISLRNILGYSFSNKRMSCTIWVCADLGSPHALEIIVYSVLDILVVGACAVEFGVYDSWEHLSIESNWLLSKYLRISNIALSELSKRVVMGTLFDLFFDLSSTSWNGSSDCVLCIEHFLADVGLSYKELCFGLRAWTCWTWFGWWWGSKLPARNWGNPASFVEDMHLKYEICFFLGFIFGLKCDFIFNSSKYPFRFNYLLRLFSTL